jgi:DNA invertase Pin-like site-specific DNA recombinase
VFLPKSKLVEWQKMTRRRRLALAEDERERINRRSDAGRKAARYKGVKFGRKPALTPYQQDEALEMLEAGKSLRAVGRTFGVNASTIQRLKDR